MVWKIIKAIYLDGIKNYSVSCKAATLHAVLHLEKVSIGKVLVMP